MSNTYKSLIMSIDPSPFIHFTRSQAIMNNIVGFGHVSLSHQVMPMVRIVPRGYTSCADAYLTPHIKKYLQGFSSGFKNNLEGTRVLFMQSDGGLTPMHNFNGSRAILSGPAGNFCPTLNYYFLYLLI